MFINGVSGGSHLFSTAYSFLDVLVFYWVIF